MNSELINAELNDEHKTESYLMQREGSKRNTQSNYTILVHPRSSFSCNPSKKKFNQTCNCTRLQSIIPLTPYKMRNSIEYSSLHLANPNFQNSPILNPIVSPIFILNEKITNYTNYYATFESHRFNN